MTDGKKLVRNVLGGTFLLCSIVASPQVLYAETTFEDLFSVAESLNQAAIASHAKIEAIEDERNNLRSDYKSSLKTIDGLKIYNRQLELRIAKQEQQMATLNKSIDEVNYIQRQMTPLMLRMIEGLDNFVQLDVPFLMDERVARVERLRDLMNRPDVSVSEQFSQVLQAYRIENEYGRTMNAYRDNVEVGGVTRDVDVLRVGRVALIYQTQDGEETGFYNKQSGQWEELPDKFTIPTRNGLKIARKQLTSGLFVIPVVIPEEKPEA